MRPHRRLPQRTVPAHIEQPDYGSHPEGIPESEEAIRGSTQIKVLDDDEIEGMRVACKVSNCNFYLLIFLFIKNINYMNTNFNVLNSKFVQ